MTTEYPMTSIEASSDAAASTTPIRASARTRRSSNFIGAGGGRSDLVQQLEDARAALGCRLEERLAHRGLHHRAPGVLLRLRLDVDRHAALGLQVLDRRRRGGLGDA